MFIFTMRHLALGNSDFESNDMGTEILGENEEAVEEKKEKLDKVPLSLSSQMVKHIFNEMDRINFKLANFLDALSWGDVGSTQDPKIRAKGQYY
jgi:hypothetical protein